MGTVLSYILPANTGRTDDPDPVTGLTSRERYLVQSSWAKVMKDPTNMGVLLLKMFLGSHPQYIQLFPFRDIPADQLTEHVKFRAHANNVIYAFSAYIDALNDTDLLIQLLQKTGSSHIKHSAPKEGFIHLKEVLLQLFSSLRPEEVAAWKKTLDVAFSVVLKSLAGEK